jgi:hypothetical protein
VQPPVQLLTPSCFNGRRLTLNQEYFSMLWVTIVMTTELGVVEEVGYGMVG